MSFLAEKLFAEGVRMHYMFEKSCLSGRSNFEFNNAISAIGKFVIEGLSRLASVGVALWVGIM